MNELSENLDVLDSALDVGWIWQLSAENTDGVDRYIIHFCYKGWVTDNLYAVRPLPSISADTFDEVVRKASIWIMKEIGDYETYE